MHQGDDRQRLIGGRYRLSVQLGSGAMGTVWSGYDEVLRRRVAVKELKVPRGVPHREALAMRERMLREARALGGLSHPNVITVYDVVDADGEPMVVLEMVPSRNLATLISEQGVLSTIQAAVVGFATAAALRAAHRAGITHRDVKPGNVLVAHDGQVKLTDFGIARNVADAPMTTAGLVLGSPAYIAPEIAAGQPVTPAADLWGLGATLFAAVEGRPPYDVRGDPVSTITEVVDGEVPRPTSAGPVTEVIAALMVKDPTQRMPLGEVRRRLRPLIGDPDDPLYPGSPDAPTMAAAYPVASGSTSGASGSGGSGPAGRAGGTSSGGGTGSGPGGLSGGAAVASSGAPAAPALLAASPGPLPEGLLAGGAEPASPEPPRGEQQRAEQSRGEQSRAEQPRAEQSRGEQSRGEQPRAEQSRGEQPRTPSPDEAETEIRKPVAEPRPASGLRAVGLVAAGAAVVLAGLAGGWAVTRAVSGQSPLTTVTVATAATALRAHTDELGFTARVPHDWTERRSGDAVSFRSPDGSEELTVARAGSADEVADTLTPEALGTADVRVDPREPVPGTDATQLVYRTVDGDLPRTGWIRVLPVGDGVLTVELTAPGGRSEGVSAELFDVVASQVAPITG